MAGPWVTAYVTLSHWDLPQWLCPRGTHANDASKGAVLGTAELGAGPFCSGRAWQTLRCPRLVIRRILNPRCLNDDRHRITWQAALLGQALFGGLWLDPGIIDKFTIYAEQAFERLGPKVHFWATLNEPKTVVNLGYSTGLHAPGRGLHSSSSQLNLSRLRHKITPTNTP